MMLVMDPPGPHARLRELVNKAFTPRRIAALRGAHRGDRRRAARRAARAASSTSIADARRAAAGDRDRRAARRAARGPRQFKAWAAEIVAVLGQPDPRRPAAGDGAGACRDCSRYLDRDHRGAARRAARRPDQRHDRRAQEENDALTRRRAARAPATCSSLAGHETTTNLIGNGLLHAAASPARARAAARAIPALLADRDRGAAALRRARCRLTLAHATRGLELGGAAHRRRARCCCARLGAANRDPRRLRRARPARRRRAPTTATSPSASARTSVWARRSRGSRARSRSAPWSRAFPA